MADDEDATASEGHPDSSSPGLAPFACLTSESWDGMSSYRGRSDMMDVCLDDDKNAKN